MYIRINIHIYIYVNSCICMLKSIYTYVFIYMYTNIHIFTRIHIHRYIDTQIHRYIDTYTYTVVSTLMDHFPPPDPGESPARCRPGLGPSCAGRTVGRLVNGARHWMSLKFPLVNGDLIVVNGDSIWGLMGTNGDFVGMNG